MLSILEIDACNNKPLGEKISAYWRLNESENLIN